VLESSLCLADEHVKEAVHGTKPLTTSLCVHVCVCRGSPLGPFFEQFGAVPAGPMTAFKLLRNKEQVVSLSSRGERPPPNCLQSKST
jgi:hypothetical protein